MLILQRRIGEAILIGEDVEMVIHGITGTQVSVGFIAKKEVKIDRKEVRLDRGRKEVRDEGLAAGRKASV